MPWKETDRMEQKEQFIQEMLMREIPFNHLCVKYGISEKTGYKWKRRFEEQGKSGLCDQSRARVSQDAIDGDTAAELIRIKNAHTAWGAKKILVIYTKIYPNKPVPSLSSVKRILSKAGLVKRKRTRPPTTSDCPRLQNQIQAEAANDVWNIDFKGWWKSDGETCEPFTVRDRYSRKVLCAKLMTSKSSLAVRAVMTELFKTYGLPKVIHSDNGAPFAAPNGLLRLTNLSVWWITLGILPERSLKAHPEMNGSLERFHRDIAEEVERKVPGGIRANQAYLDKWVEEYNSIRPNEAIGMKTPDELYTKSSRKYTGDYDELEYPFGFLVRKVTKGGEIILNGLRVTIGYALRGWHVGLKAMGESGKYQVYLADFLLGTLDSNSCCFYPLECLESD